jgi:hypothetical protein
MHWKIALLAVETGLSPRELLELSPRMLFTIEKYLTFKYSAQHKARRRR